MANDAFEAFYAEKLWELLPAIHRDEDGRGENPGALRALVEIVAAEAARLRRSTDRVWEDAFIETCDEWAIPYIGDLLATRLVSALNPRGRRVDVAKTIYYRRRKGTPFVLEELIVDIAGWEGIVVEGFRRLARAAHRLDASPAALGRFTGTPAGGTADLRRPRAAEVANGPFDEFAHLPDVRRPRGEPMPGAGLGRIDLAPAPRAGDLPTAGIAKVGFHLYRLGSHAVTGVDPAPGEGDTGFRFDPSGRDVPLFMRSARVRGTAETPVPGFEDWHAAAEWELPAPMRCRVLGHAVYVPGDRAIAALADVPGMSEDRQDQLRRLRGVRLVGEAELRRALGTLPDGAFFTGTVPLRAIRRELLVPDCGKAALIPASVEVATGGDAVPRERLAAGRLLGWSTTAPDRIAVIDPELGRLRFADAPAAPPRVSYHYGTPGRYAAGTYARPEAAERVPTRTVSGGGTMTAGDFPAEGVVSVLDSRTYVVRPSRIEPEDLVVQAADGERPYLRRRGRFTIAAAGDESTIRFDGIWLGAEQARVEVRIDGGFRLVALAHSTFDPGGRRSDLDGADTLPEIELVITGSVDRLEIARSIVGRIRTAGGGRIGRLAIRDSVVDAGDGGTAIVQTSGETVLERVTVLGDMRLHRLYATETLVAGMAEVTDTQSGCFRFGAAHRDSRLPHPYRSVALDDLRPLFVSRRFGNPAYATLAPAAPAQVRTGAESGSEMGAFSGLNGPIRMESLRAKVAEYMPFGLVPFFIAET